MNADPSEAHYMALGKLTANWSALEMMIVSAIWQIAEIPDEIGASITSNIFSLDSKMKALQAVLHVRQSSELEAVAKKLTPFFDKKLRPLLEFRNRRIHDPVLFFPEGTKRLQVTANRRLKMGYEEESISEIEQRIEDIRTALEEFEGIIKPAIEACPPLPKSSLRRPA